METRKLQLLLHPLFVLSLACLLLNDFYWKYVYHNWLTGKLSDLAGLFVLSVFLFAGFPRYRRIICFGVIVFFIWWKTPLSQPVIDLLNNLFSVTFTRTIDYSDYLVLPVAFAPYVIKIPEFRFSFQRRVAACFISAVCFVAFCSTTILRKFTIAPDFSRRVSYMEEYKTRLSRAQVLNRLDSLGLNYKIDSFTIAPLNFYGGSLLIRKRDSIEKDWMVIEPEQKDTAVFVRINERRPYIAIYDFNAGSEVFPQVNIIAGDDYYSTRPRIFLASVFLNEKQMEEYSLKSSKTKIRIRKLLEKELITKLK